MSPRKAASPARASGGTLPSGTHGQAPLGFEEAIGQLEAIITRMESGEIGLEASMAEYERGVALARRCREILTQAEQKLEELSRDDARPNVPETSAPEDV
jgi:exodeoxyribonuclease VII small subunit